MSQREAIDWLRQHPGWHRAAEVGKIIGATPQNACANLNRLVKWGDAEKRTEGKAVYWRAI